MPDPVDLAWLLETLTKYIFWLPWLISIVDLLQSHNVIAVFDIRLSTIWSTPLTQIDDADSLDVQFWIQQFEKSDFLISRNKAPPVFADAEWIKEEPLMLISVSLFWIKIHICYIKKDMSFFIYADMVFWIWYLIYIYSTIQNIFDVY